MQKLDAQNKTCDLVTVSDAMPNFDSTLLVDLLQSGMPSLVLCDQYVANVKAAGMRRALCKIAQQTVELARNELTDPVKAAEEIRGQIDELAKNGPTQEIVSIPQMILNMHDYLFAEQKTDDSMHTELGGWMVCWAAGFEAASCASSAQGHPLANRHWGCLSLPTRHGRESMSCMYRLRWTKPSCMTAS